MVLAQDGKAQERKRFYRSAMTPGRHSHRPPRRRPGSARATPARSVPNGGAAVPCRRRCAAHASGRSWPQHSRPGGRQCGPMSGKGISVRGLRAAPPDPRRGRISSCAPDLAQCQDGATGTQFGQRHINRCAAGRRSRSVAGRTTAGWPPGPRQCVDGIRRFAVAGDRARAGR